MRITIKDFNTSLGLTNSFDIVNAIRNEASPQFQQYVPLANAENVAEVGQGLLASQTLQNEFITSLVDRIALVVLRKVSLKNHLAKFKKGNLPLGRKIEEIFVDITKEQMYDPEEAENTVFKREIPDVKTLFHERNRQGFYTQTIQDASLASAFTSWGTFDNFVSQIINAIYNSSEVDEFKYMKLLIENYFSKGLFTTVKVLPPTDATSASEFVKKMRVHAKKMTLPTGSREYNAMAVHTRTEMDDLHLIIDADLEATLDVDVLAKAFNMDKTTFLGNVTVIDGFASSGLEAVLIDKDWFMVYDTLHKMETIRNPKGLYWNYFYHVWQVLSVSRFSNAVAFVSGDVPPVTQVIVDPTLATLKQGASVQLTAYVRENDGANRDVVWSVVGGSAGTSITQEGVLTFGASQTGEVHVKATVTYTEADGVTTKDVVGEAIVMARPSA